MDPQPRRSSRLLIDETPLQLLPSLAVRYGLHEAIIVQQMHYRLQRSKHEHDGRRWLYNSYREWHDHFSFLTVSQIRRAIEHLEREGVLLAGNYNRSAMDRTKWYTIDYDALETAAATVTNAFVTNDKWDSDLSPVPDDLSPVTNGFGTHDTPIPIDVQETITRESAPAPATGDISPQPPSSNGYTSNGSSPGRHMNARPVLAADETPPPVVVKVPPGTPVNRRPDAPPLRPVPKPEKPAASLARWQPGPDEQAWWAEQCQDEQIPLTAIDVSLETKKWREAESSQGLKPSQYARYWRMWLYRAIERWRDRQASAPTGKAPPRRRSIDEVDL